MAAEQDLALPAPAPRPLLGAPRDGERRKLFILVGVVLVSMALAFAIGYFFHHKRQRAAEEAADRAKSALPSVNAVTLRRSTSTSRLLLPGSVMAITEASVFARASGYVRNRRVDIGDRVSRGQVLAEIESPELDQQVAQARQQLGQASAAVDDAKARVDLARVTWERYRTLVEQDSASRQDADQKYQESMSAQAMLQSSIANARAADANLQRLVAMQEFEKLRAPFDGVITARNVDVGALIGASGGASSAVLQGGPSGASDTELFRIAQTGRLRVLISVPQPNSSAIRIGAPASVHVHEVHRPFEGKVTRTANALDPVSRTLLTEVQIANPDGTLLPGMYAQIQLSGKRDNPPLLIPGSALLMESGGTQIAILEDLNDQDREKVKNAMDGQKAKRVHVANVSVGRDYGTEIEITAGLEGDEWIVSNPGDAVKEGAIVLPRFAQQGARQGGEGKPGGPSEKSPSGIGSPSMEAPMQGEQKGGGKKGEEKGRGKKDAGDAGKSSRKTS